MKTKYLLSALFFSLTLSLGINNLKANENQNEQPDYLVAKKNFNLQEIENNKINFDKNIKVKRNIRMQKIEPYENGYLVKLDNNDKELYLNNIKDNTYSNRSIKFNKSTHKSILKDAKLWENKLSNKEKKAIGYYTGKYSFPLNNYLINGTNKKYKNLKEINGTKKDKKFIKQNIPYLKSGINKFILSKPYTFYRGTSLEAMQTATGKNKIQVGDIYRNKGYSSTTLKKWVSKGYALSNKNPVVMQINMSKGHNGAYIEKLSKYKFEKEFLLKNNKPLVITKIENKYIKKIKANYTIITLNS